MEIIEVTHEKQVQEPHITYCAETPHEAVNSFQTKFGITPEKVYHKASKGRSTVYVPAPDYIMQLFYSGVFYGVNQSG